VAKKTNSGYESEDLKKQRIHLQNLKETGFQFPLIAADAFVQGMRDSGYRNTGTAIDEFVDNAFQAEAQRVAVVLGYDRSNTSQKKPDYIAIVDDGHGMDPDVIRYAILWGGTHRFNDRSGFGRFGFGLPSAAVSVTPRYSVYSKVPGGEWSRVTIDLHEIVAHKYTDDRGVVIAPDAQKDIPPKFLRESFPIEELEHGTVILLEHPDRLSAGFGTSESFVRKMSEHLGLIYRGIIRDRKIQVIDGLKDGAVIDVEPVDPLFLTPGAKFYDADPEVMAEAIEPLSFEVKDKGTGKPLGVVQVRYSYMPPKFQGDKPKNARFPVMKVNEGLTVVRSGRQIDVVKQFPDQDSISIVNYDRNWGAEISFDPVLDEEFGVTTNKQQITLTDRMWDLLRQNGVIAAIKQLRKRFDEELHAAKAKENEGKPRSSEEILAESDKFRKAPPTTVEKQKEQQERLKKEVERQKRATGKPEEEITSQILNQPYKIEFEKLPGAPFYRAEQIGGQKRVYINLAHRFYTDVYEGSDSSPRVKTALEILLFVLGSCEIEATGDRERFYAAERGEWSKQLATNLDLFEERDSTVDAKSARDAKKEADSIPVKV